MRIARQSTLPYEDRFEKRGDENGRTLYMLVGGRSNEAEHPETDLHALRQGYVSVTPLRFELTDHGALARLEIFPGRRG